MIMRKQRKNILFLQHYFNSMMKIKEHTLNSFENISRIKVILWKMLSFLQFRQSNDKKIEQKNLF